MEDKIGIAADNNHSSIEDDDSMKIASKCWNRVMNAAIKTGYREGILDGADSVLQEGFDIGYKDGFKIAFLLGKYKSLHTATLLKPPTDIEALLNATKHGVCYICSTEVEKESDNTFENIPFSEILSKQRSHSAEVLDKLHEHFKPILEESGIKIDLSLK